MFTGIPVIRAMSHPVHHALEIRAACEKPRRVRLPETIDPNADVDARRFDSRQPHSGSEVSAKKVDVPWRESDELCGDKPRSSGAPFGEEWRIARKGEQLTTPADLDGSLLRYCQS